LWDQISARPQSSLAAEAKPAFVEENRASVAKELQAAPSTATTSTSTSTFVAAARRAQRARQEETTEDADTIIGKALAFVRPRRDAELAAPEVPAAASTPAPEAAKRAIFRARLKTKTESAPPAFAEIEGAEEDTVPHQNVLKRYRRPILLATALTAVSVLAINLVLQRTEQTSVAQAPASTVSSPEQPSPVTSLTDPTPAAGLSDTLVAPNVTDLIDPTATGSINPGAPMSFSRPNVRPNITMPPPLER
jgi:localization factor PodJL